MKIAANFVCFLCIFCIAYVQNAYPQVHCPMNREDAKNDVRFRLNDDNEYFTAFGDNTSKYMSCEYGKNGLLYKEINKILKSGYMVHEGMTKVYYEDGKIESEVQSKDGKREGIAKEYYESGKIESESSYKRRKRRRSDGV